MNFFEIVLKHSWSIKAGIHGNIIFAGSNHKGDVNDCVTSKQVSKFFKQGSHKTQASTGMSPIKVCDYACP